MAATITPAISPAPMLVSEVVALLVGGDVGVDVGESDPTFGAWVCGAALVDTT